MAHATLTLRPRLLLEVIESKFQGAVFATPFVSDVFRNHWKFLSLVGACRGVYPSYDAAAIEVTMTDCFMGRRLSVGPRSCGSGLSNIALA
jgi:hypothetical protein